MAHQVLSILESQQLRNFSHSSSILSEEENQFKNSRNQSSQRSLLTEALRASSEKQNTDTFEQEYLGQVLLKPRFQDYSLAQQSIIEDELQKFSLRSLRCGGKSKEKMLTSFVQKTQNQNKENQKTFKRKEIRLKRESHCSKCEIF